MASGTSRPGAGASIPRCSSRIRRILSRCRARSPPMSAACRSKRTSMHSSRWPGPAGQDLCHRRRSENALGLEQQYPQASVVHQATAISAKISPTHILARRPTSWCSPAAPIPSVWSISRPWPAGFRSPPIRLPGPSMSSRMASPARWTRTSRPRRSCYQRSALDRKACRERALKSGWDVCSREFESNLERCETPPQPKLILASRLVRESALDNASSSSILPSRTRL